MSTKRRKKGHGGGGGGGGHGGGDSRWLVTYADLLTVLMVLFLVLWTISSIDLKKFEKFKSGLGDFGNPAAAQASAADLASVRLSAQSDVTTNYFALRISEQQIHGGAQSGEVRLDYGPRRCGYPRLHSRGR